jgi:chaperonin GroEL
MVTNPASLEAVLDDPYILLTNEKITKVQQLMPVLDKIMRAGDPRAFRPGVPGQGYR